MKLVEVDTNVGLYISSIYPDVMDVGPYRGQPILTIGFDEPSDGEDTYNSHSIIEWIEAKRLHPVKNARAKRIVALRGDDPFRQNIRALCQALWSYDYVPVIHCTGEFGPDPGTEITKTRRVDGDAEMPGFWLNALNIDVVCKPRTKRIKGSLLPHITHCVYYADLDRMGSDGLLPDLAKPPASLVPSCVHMIYTREDEKEALTEHGYTLVKVGGV